MFADSMKLRGHVAMSIIGNPKVNWVRTDIERGRIFKFKKDKEDSNTPANRNNERENKTQEQASNRNTINKERTLTHEAKRNHKISSKCSKGNIRIESLQEGNQGQSPEMNQTKDNSCKESAGKSMEGGARESCLLEYLKYFQSIICARSLPCDDGEKLKSQTPLYPSWRRKASKQTKKEPKPVAVPKQPTNIKTETDLIESTAIESTANLNAWSQIYYDITRYSPPKHTKLNLPEIFLTSVHTNSIFLETKRDVKNTIEITQAISNLVEQGKAKEPLNPHLIRHVSPKASKHDKKSEASKQMLVEERFTPAHEKRTTSAHHNENNTDQTNQISQTNVSEQINKDGPKKDESVDHHTKNSRKHLNNLGSNMLFYVNQAKNQAQGLFGNKKVKQEDTSASKHVSIMEDQSDRVTDIAEWFGRYRGDKKSFHLEIRPCKYRSRKKSYETASVGKHCNRNDVICNKEAELGNKQEVNFEKLRRRIKKKHNELEALRKSIQKEAKEVCSELNKFREHEYQHTKKRKLKEKQDNNGSKYVNGTEKDQEKDKEKNQLMEENYRDLLQKYLLVEEECKLFREICHNLQDQKPRITEMRAKSGRMATNRKKS